MGWFFVLDATDKQYGCLESIASDDLGLHFFLAHSIWGWEAVEKQSSHVDGHAAMRKVATR